VVVPASPIALKAERPADALVGGLSDVGAAGLYVAITARAADPLQLEEFGVGEGHVSNLSR
jgi:hypothetical protein